MAMAMATATAMATAAATKVATAMDTGGGPRCGIGRDAPPAPDRPSSRSPVERGGTMAGLTFGHVDGAAGAPVAVAGERAMIEAPRVRPPSQARSQATMDRFVQATRDLLEERPFEEITVADIVGRAERTVGSFYARFEDKHAVLRLLLEQVD